MANISAADVKKLRELTGAGMMDCKKALTEADGDFDKSVEILRIKGGKKMAERAAEREASAGLVATSGGALVELNCETDFVAKGDDFVAVAQKIADAAAEATEQTADRWLDAARLGLRDPDLATSARRCLDIALAQVPRELELAITDLAELVDSGRSPGDIAAERIAEVGPLAHLGEIAHA